MFRVVSFIELLDNTMIPLHFTDQYATLPEAAAAGLELNAPFVVWTGSRPGWAGIHRVLTWVGDKR